MKFSEKKIQAWVFEALGQGVQSDNPPYALKNACVKNMKSSTKRIEDFVDE